MNGLPTKAWICPVCGYIHYGAEPPDECPVCACEKELFEAYVEPAPVKEMPQADGIVAQPSVRINRVIIIGAGIAGVSAAEALRKTDERAEIILVSNEPQPPYYRMNLTRYLAGEIGAGQLELRPAGWYAENHIQLMHNLEVCALDLQHKEVLFQDGQRMAFDKLILTVGAHPFVPSFPGADRGNVTTLRSQADADFILQNCLGNKRCVCIGGGLLGLETAGALARRGVQVTVLENQGWLLPRQLNITAGKLLQKQIETMGITLRTQARTRELLGDQSVSGVQLEDGSIIPADVVVISAGIRSNLDLARQAGLLVNQGILVDDTMQTSHPDVYAAGDATEHRGIVYGTWAPSQSQGAIAGMNAGGQCVEFAGIPRSNTLKVLGYDLFSIGRIEPADPADVLIDAEDEEGRYACFVFHAQILVGAILLGDTRFSTRVKKAIENGLNCAALLNEKAEAWSILDYIASLP